MILRIRVSILLEVLGHERGLDVEVVVEAVLDRRPDARAGRPGTGPAPPGPSRARWSAAGCRGRRRCRWRPARPRRRRRARGRGRAGTPSTRAAITSGWSRKSSHALVPGVTVRSSRASAWTRTTWMSDTVAPRKGVDLDGRDRIGEGASGYRVGGRYWVRTSDLFGVNEARYHCANRPGCAPSGMRRRSSAAAGP